VKTLPVAARIGTKRRAKPSDLKPQSFHSRHRTGRCEFFTASSFSLSRQLKVNWISIQMAH
jgi:hypothetical protein